MKQRIIGLDLDEPYSQISFYSEQTREPETVSVGGDGQNYLIPTPERLFFRVENEAEGAVTELAEFILDCISRIHASVRMADVYLMVTMRSMRRPWTQALRRACGLLGIAAEHLFLQTHRESFYAYVLSQKRDLWVHKVALFEYEETKITAHVLSIDYGTRPALVSVTPGEVKELGFQNRRSQEEWDARRDELFLELIRDTFAGDTFSSVFLVGESFDKTWAVDSLQYLCRRRHVFQGRNLYTKGACHAMCIQQGVQKGLSQYLYSSEDMIETNLSMELTVHGETKNILMVSAGQNWFGAVHTCEILLDDMRELVIYGKSMVDGTMSSYSISLPDLPERPPRTTRLELKIEFLAADRCRLTVRDLGFGEFFAASGLAWESELEV